MGPKGPFGPFQKSQINNVCTGICCFIQSFRKAMFLHTTMSCNGSSHPLLHQRHQPSAQIKARAKGYHELRGFSHPPLNQWHQPSTQIKAKAKGYHELRGSSHPLLYQWHQLSTAHPCNLLRCKCQDHSGRHLPESPGSRQPG